MPAIPAARPANVAEQLRHDEVHVWHLNYRPAQRRAPLHAVLAGYLGINIGQVILREEAYGRPALAGAADSALGFNWSHSGPHAMIALGCGITPGIDLEQLRTRPRALAIARRFFSIDEVRMLETVAPSERSAAFLRVWTAKEAVLKAHGRGLAFGLDRLSIDFGTDGLALQRMEGESVEAWQLLSLASDAPVVAALAWRGAARRVQHFRLVDAGE